MSNITSNVKSSVLRPQSVNQINKYFKRTFQTIMQQIPFKSSCVESIGSCQILWGELIMKDFYAHNPLYFMKFKTFAYSLVFFEGCVFPFHIISWSLLVLLLSFHSALMCHSLCPVSLGVLH